MHAIKLILSVILKFLALLLAINVGLIAADKYNEDLAAFRQEVAGSPAKDLINKRLTELDTARTQWKAASNPDLQAASQMAHVQYMLLVDISKSGLKMDSAFVKRLRDDMDAIIQSMNYSVKKCRQATQQQKEKCESTTYKLHYDFLNFGGAIDHVQFTEDIDAAKIAFRDLSSVKYIAYS